MRKSSYGQNYNFSFLDKCGIYLSHRKIIRFVKKNRPKRIIDIGCGYQALLLQRLKHLSKQLVGIDIHTDPKIKGIKFFNLKIDDNLRFLKSESADLIVMNNLLEHLRKPEPVLKEVYRVLRKEGYFINVVPNWRGRFFLELAAFKFKLAPIEEMNDHVTYYDKRDIYPLLFKAGFLPINMKIKYHKFLLSTISYAQK